MIKEDHLGKYTELISSGSTPKGGSDNYLDQGEILFIRSQNVLMNKFSDHDALYIPLNIHEKMKRTWVKNRDVLLNITGASIGRTTVYMGEDNKANVNQHVCIIRLKDFETVDPFYLSYFLASPSFQRHIMKINAGATRQALNFSQIGKFKIPIPPIQTQKKIVEMVKKAEKLKEWRAEADGLVDEYLKIVFLEMFGDPQNNHNDFKIGKIQDLITKTQYGTSSKANEENKGHPILRMNNITYSGKWDFSSLKHIELDEKDKEKYLVYNGELLFNRTNSKELVGKAAVFRRDEPMAFAGYLVKILTDSPATSEYIAAHLNSHYGKAFLFNMAKSIVGMANINAKEVQRIPILIPPVELREQYAEIVKRHEDLREMQSQSKQQIDNLFNTLMQKAFKGELVC